MTKDDEKVYKDFIFSPKESIDSISIIISCLIFDNFLLTLYRIVSGGNLTMVFKEMSCKLSTHYSKVIQKSQDLLI